MSRRYHRTWEEYAASLQPEWPPHWTAVIEQKARDAKLATARDAWWLRGRLNYQFHELASQLGVSRTPAAMVRVR